MIKVKETIVWKGSTKILQISYIRLNDSFLRQKRGTVY